MPHDKHVPCHRPWARNRRTSATSVVFGNDTINHLLSYGSKPWYPRYHKIAIILYSSYKVVYIYILSFLWLLVAGSKMDGYSPQIGNNRFKFWPIPNYGQWNNIIEVMACYDWLWLIMVNYTPNSCHFTVEKHGKSRSNSIEHRISMEIWMEQKAAFLSRFSDKQLKDVRTCGPLADPSSCCDRARWTLPCLGAAIPMWQSGRFPSSRDGHNAMLVIRKKPEERHL